ncbi:glycosyltransferase [Lacihabitans sp. CCS-44]|uniref:glycosyltransferase family 4 protein n=1 Tax=Lacihabitans sp. CCS-44 TaxID=2487331 RepID=UPI0020CF7620|nr:glycosyltransferase family 4 protein [Lacihabitans sp. CCS-44]MCP9757315.1 glycosyltransferase [Lacihabitans sp. CCS-44]
MKIHLVSSTDFMAKGTGVHSAFVGMFDLLKEKNDVEVLRNQEGFGDIFHSHSYGLYYFLKSRKYKGRRIHTVHTTPATIKGSVVFPSLVLPFAKLYFKKVFNHADVCIAISPMVEKNLRELGVTSKIINIGNPIDLDKWYPSVEKRVLGRKLIELDIDKKVVLGVGQLQKRKGVEDFIELAEKHPDIYFVWAGSRPFGAITEGVRRINQRIEEAPENVKFIGQVDLENMPNLYAAADVFLFPSYQENSPLSPIEAAATGLPVLFRDLSEYEMLYESDYLKAKNNLEFSRLISNVFEDKKYMQYAKELSATLVKQFDKNAIRKKLISLYENVYNGLDIAV